MSSGSKNATTWLAGRAQHGASEIAVRTRVLPMGVPPPLRSTLEIIRFTAASHLWVDLNYDGRGRSIEPYSLRQTADAYFVLHATRRDPESIGLTVWTVFVPRCTVERTSAEPSNATQQTCTISQCSSTSQRSSCCWGPRFRRRT